MGRFLILLSTVCFFLAATAPADTVTLTGVPSNWIQREDGAVHGSLGSFQGAGGKRYEAGALTGPLLSGNGSFADPFRWASATSLLLDDAPSFASCEYLGTSGCVQLTFHNPTGVALGNGIFFMTSLVTGQVVHPNFYAYEGIPAHSNLHGVFAATFTPNFGYIDFHPDTPFYRIKGDITLHQAPEPGTLLLLGSGVAAAVRRRKVQSATRRAAATAVSGPKL